MGCIEIPQRNVVYLVMFYEGFFFLVYFYRLFGNTGLCAACNKVIPAFEMVMRARSNVYHLECFACQQCNHRYVLIADKLSFGFTSADTGESPYIQQYLQASHSKMRLLIKELRMC